MKGKILTISLLIIGFQFANAQISTDGLVGYWSFTGNANDESGNSNNGTVYGATLTEDRFGNANSAYYFDGVDDYIGIAPTSLVDNETAITVSCWLKREVDDSYGLPIHTGNQGRFGIHVKQDSITVNVTTDSNFDGSAPSEFSTPLIKYDQTIWNHIVLRYDGVSLRIYVNNKLESEIYAEGKIWTPQSSYLAFGVYMLFGNPNHAYYKGILDDVRIYNTALTNEEIKAIAQNGLCDEIIKNDTVSYNVSSIDFEDISPKVIFDSTQTLTQSNGICDSVINHYSKFVFDPLYCTDTITTEVTDTTFVTIQDTITTEVKDTLIIDAVLTGIDEPDNINTLKVYPNPAKDHIFINTGDFTRMNGYQLKIINNLGVTVFETMVEEPLYEVNLSDWSGYGMYYLQVIDSGGSIIDIRKIILQ